MTIHHVLLRHFGSGSWRLLAPDLPCRVHSPAGHRLRQQRLEVVQTIASLFRSFIAGNFYCTKQAPPAFAMQLRKAPAMACVLLALVLVSESTVVSATTVQERAPARRLLQWGGWNRGGWNAGNAQFARNNAAIVNSQMAIANAVASGASLPATAGAAYYAQDQAQQAAYGVGPWPYGRWGWGRRRAAA